MKLYDAGRAPNPRRVRIYLAEKGLSVPLVQVDLGALEHKGPEYTAINPIQRVPSLVLDDGMVISESIAICRYFEELHPEPPMFGKGALERALVDMWQRRVEFGLLERVAAVFRHLHPAMAAMENPQITVWGEANRPRVAEFLAFLDSHLGASEFVAGEAFSVADITAIVAIDLMKPAKLAMPDGLSNLRRWHEQVSARPSVKA